MITFGVCCSLPSFTFLHIDVTVLANGSPGYVRLFADTRLHLEISGSWMEKVWVVGVKVITTLSVCFADCVVHFLHVDIMILPTT